MRAVYDDLLFHALRGARQPLPQPEDPRLLSPRLRAHHAVLFERVQNQIKKDLAPITLVDGSNISLKKAHSILARKEERDTFANLRELIDESHRAFEDRERALQEHFGHALENAAEDYRNTFGDDDAPLLHEGTNAPLGESTRADLRALSHTLQDAALVAVDVLGGVRKGHDLQRAVERPNAQGLYANQGAQQLSRALKEVLPLPVRAHTLKGPRALLGRVMTHPNTREPLVVVSDVLRSDAFLTLLHGRCEALIRALLDDKNQERSDDKTLSLLADAFALSLTSAPSLRGVFHATKARDNARELIAVRVLKTFLSATLLSHESEEEGKERIYEMLSLESPRFEARFLTPALWPMLRSPEAERAHRTFFAAEGAQIFQTMRSHFDESFALFADAPQALLEVQEQLRVPEALYSADFELTSQKETHLGGALVALLWEMI